MKPGSLLQLDWHLTQEATEIFQTLFLPNSLRLRKYGLLEKPGLPRQLDEVSYKIFVSGSSGVGKTSFISKLTGSVASNTYCETPGIQVSVVYWPVKLQRTARVVMFRLEFWDAGESSAKKFDHILPSCNESVDSILFVFSFLDRMSFEELPQQMARNIQPSSERPCAIVVGTKYDQFQSSEVTQRDVREFEQRWKVPIIKAKNVHAAQHSVSEAVSVPQNKMLQDFHDAALSLNIICNQLWQRDQTLASLSMSPS